MKLLQNRLTQVPAHQLCEARREFYPAPCKSIYSEIGSKEAGSNAGASTM